MKSARYGRTGKGPGRLACLTVCLVLLCACAAAAGEGKSHIPCTCGQAQCVCFLQEGDRGRMVRAAALALRREGFLQPKGPTLIFTPDIRGAVQAFQRSRGLAETGMLDDATLTWLLWGMPPEELDAALPVRRRQMQTYTEPVWIPAEGGSRRHGDPGCSGMRHPRRVSIRNAAKAGYAACLKCQEEREQTVLTWGK